MAEYTGACKYCGQVQFIKGGATMTDEQITEAATLQCTCDAAQEHQKATRKANYAEANIKELFGEDGETIINALIPLAKPIAWGRIVKVSMTTEQGIKATLTAKASAIRVERTETNKKALED